MSIPVLGILYKSLGHAMYITGSIFAGILAIDVNFRDEITLGTMLLGGLVVIIAGIFTVRSKITKSWHDAFDAEKTRKEQAEEELKLEQRKRIDFEAEQQRLRHDLKNDLATRDLQIKALESKTDLTTAMLAIKTIADAQERATQETRLLLTEIRDRMPPLNT